MRTFGAFRAPLLKFLDTPCSRWLPLHSELPFLEPPPRCAPTPAPALLPDQRSLVSHANTH
eukprot:6177856-Pleurochrysis_carterae.AAC.1